MSNMVRAKVTIRGTRTLVQHHFGPDAIPLEKAERTGVAGNSPDEWKKTCLVDENGELYLPGTYIFSCLKNGAFFTKKGRGSLQSPLVSTLQVEDDTVLLNRTLPENVTTQSSLSPTDQSVKTFIWISTVRNPATKGRNVRYRLATRSGWKCFFTIVWDKTVIAREQMKAILRDSGTLGGLGDGIRIGCGRFEVLQFEELDNAQEETTERDLGFDKRNGVEQGRKKVRAL